MNLNSDDPLVKLNRFFIGRVCFVAAMGGFLFGYDWVVIGGAKPFYESYFGIADSAMLQGLGMSSALFGCLLGAVFSGSLANRLGPKSLLICAAVLFVISAIGTAQANTFAWFCLFRIVGGIGIGLTSNLSPIYIAEIAPAKQRGQLVSLNQLSIVMGILFAQLINLAIAQDVPDSDLTEVIAMSWTGQDGWRWMFGAETVPALLFFVLLFLYPKALAGWSRLGRRRRRWPSCAVWEANNTLAKKSIGS